MQIKSLALLIVLTVGLGGCLSSPEPLVVSGKEFVYPRINSEWLEPCQAPKIPVDLSVKGDSTSRLELMIYVTNLINAIDKCNQKIHSTKQVYTKFLEELKSHEEGSNSK